MNAINPNQKYSYADLLEWDDGKRYELLDGTPFLMAPPSRKHQELLTLLLFEFTAYLKGKTCKVYPAPFGVRLTDAQYDAEIFDYVEPDISVICDPNKLDEKGCLGAPDLVVEILSASNQQYDKWEKFNKYQKAGVKEYWIVDQFNNLIDVYKLVNGKYELSGVYDRGKSVKVGIFEDLTIELKNIFE